MKDYVTAAAVSVCCLVVAGVLWKRGRARRTVGWLLLLAGFGIGGGLLGGLLVRVGELAGRVVSVGTAKLFGVAVPAALLIGVGLWLAIDLWPRNKPSKALPYVALAFPILLSVIGGVYTGIGGEVLTTVGNGLADFSADVITSGG